MDLDQLYQNPADLGIGIFLKKLEIALKKVIYLLTVYGSNNYTALECQNDIFYENQKKDWLMRYI